MPNNNTEEWFELLNFKCRLGFQLEPVVHVLTPSGCQVDFESLTLLQYKVKYVDRRLNN